MPLLELKGLTKRYGGIVAVIDALVRKGRLKEIERGSGTKTSKYRVLNGEPGPIMELYRRDGVSTVALSEASP